MDTISAGTESEYGARAEKSLLRWLVAALFFVLVGLFVWTSWLSDDAYITFRSLTLLASDQGPNFNPGQRVQVFTHPLWYGLLAVGFFFTHELFYTTQILSIVISAVVVLGFVYLHWDRGYLGLLVGPVLLGLSSSFLDYSTSGLENPLSHLLVIAVLIGLAKISPKRNKLRPLFLGAMTSMAALARPDLSLIFLPLLIADLWNAEDRSSAVGYAALGLIPIILWEAFSLWYYGFPFPNTAYAKLHTGLPRYELILQGSRYLLTSLIHDPLTILVIGSAFLALKSTVDWERRSMALGVALYIAYVVWIGGDFMRGRFFSTPFVLSLSLVLSIPQIADSRVTRVVAVGLVALGLYSTGPKLAAGGAYGSNFDGYGPWGVADEREVYYQDTGLLADREAPRPDHSHHSLQGAVAKESNQEVVVYDNLGMFGYYAGRTIHVLDEPGLADPLLARLEPVIAEDWRIGHLQREIPAGYLESLRLGTNQIQDPSLARYYEKLSILTRGSLGSSIRMVEVLKFNLGWYDHYLDHYESSS